VVPVARRGARREKPLDARHALVVERDGCGRPIAFEVAAAARPGNRHDVGALGEQPREEDGNASDKTLNNTLLSAVAHHLKKRGIREQAFTYVADSALVVRDGGIHHIAPMPKLQNSLDFLISLGVIL
jgi:hypothetical protein